MNYDRVLKCVSFGSLILIAIVLMVATVVEKYHGQDFASQHFYRAWWLILLWGVMGVSSLIYVIKMVPLKRLATIGIHLSFAVILLGAVTSYLFGRQGRVHLRCDSDAVCVYESSDGKECILPFELALTDFQLKYYPGTLAPMDYISEVKIINTDGQTAIGEVSMNNVYSYQGYRFYQSGYDADKRGSVLLVAYDPYGIAITYIGYALLFIAMIMFFVQKRSEYKRVLKQFRLKRMLLVVILLSGCCMGASASPKVLPKSVAEEFGDLYVYYNDRVCPLQSLAKDFTVKLYGSASYKGFTPEQVLTGWFFYYDDWKNEPMIKIKGKTVRDALGISGKYARLTDFADIHGYKLEQYLTQNTMQSDMQNIYSANEKFNLVSMLCTGGLLKLYPYRGANNHVTWYSMIDKMPREMPENQWAFIRRSMNYVAEQIALGRNDDVVRLLQKIRKYQQKEGGENMPSDCQFKAERIYNEWNVNRPMALVAIVCGFFGFILSIWAMIGRRTISVARWTICIFLGVMVAYLSFQIMLRWYVSGYIPLANGYETMIFMAWSCSLIALVASRQTSLTGAIGLLSCGLTMMVAVMGEANPKITNLMPVLQSPLLSIHVAVIMLAYSLLLFMMLNSIAAIIIWYGKPHDNEAIDYLSVANRVLLCPAVFLLMAGIFVGAVWANVSWGRYWGWDPKEVWALITLIVYAVALHSTSIRRFSGSMFSHWYCVVAFLAVIITYFGVNFFLGGMHSYAG